MLNLNLNIGEVIKKMKPTNFERDERYWVPQVKKGERYEAVIRFLPDKTLKNVVEKFYEHIFQVPPRMFYCVCPTTFGEYCPLCEHVADLFEKGKTNENIRKVASERKRILRFVSNIYVVNDSTNPENNGKVFLFKYGKKINQMLQEMAEGFEEAEKKGKDFIEEEVCFPWYPDERGGFFKLIIDTSGGFYDYSASRFFKIGRPLFDDEEKIMEILKQTYSLDEIMEEMRNEARKIEAKMKEFNLLKLDIELGKDEKELEVKEEKKIKKIDVSDVEIDDDLDLDELDEVDDLDELLDDE